VLPSFVGARVTIGSRFGVPPTKKTVGVLLALSVALAGCAAPGPVPRNAVANAGPTPAPPATSCRWPALLNGQVVCVTDASAGLAAGGRPDCQRRDRAPTTIIGASNGTHLVVETNKDTIDVVDTESGSCRSSPRPPGVSVYGNGIAAISDEGLIALYVASDAGLSKLPWSMRSEMPAIGLAADAHRVVLVTTNTVFVYSEPFELERVTKFDRPMPMGVSLNHTVLSGRIIYAIATIHGEHEPVWIDTVEGTVHEMPVGPGTRNPGAVLSALAADPARPGCALVGLGLRAYLRENGGVWRACGDSLFPVFEAPLRRDRIFSFNDVPIAIDETGDALRVVTDFHVYDIRGSDVVRHRRSWSCACGFTYAASGARIYADAWFVKMQVAPDAHWITPER
jgi:hypothetical protein